MPSDPDAHRYKWLRVILGAVVTVGVVLALILILIRAITTWAPPGVVPVPPAPSVDISLNDHPRLVATSDAIDALSQSTVSDEYILLMEKADQFYDEYLVDPLQGDTIYPGYFALAWRISGEDRYLEAAKDMALNHCTFPRWRRRPESANYYKIELAYAVGMAYDLIFDQFSDKEREEIEESLSEVLDGLLWHLQGNPNTPFWLDAPHSNYYVAHHSAAGLLALCLGDAYPRWREALAFAYDGLQPSIEQFENDGGWIEGLTYQDFCWGQHGVLFLNSLRVNGGPNQLDENWYETSVRFALSGILPSGREQVNFGDNSFDPLASFGYLWRARAFFDSPFLDSFLAQQLPDPDYPLVPLDAILVRTILEFDPTLPLNDFPEPEPCQYFPGIEWVTLRQDWTDPDGFFFAAKAGYGGWDHNHVDQGTFILAFDGETFIVDPGRGIFSDRENADINNFYGGPRGHNVFIPGTSDDSCFWDEFTMYSENFQYRQEDARVTDWEVSRGRVHFIMNLNGAYPSEGLNKWRRHFIWYKPGAELPGGAVIIFDETELPGQVNLITPMQTGERREGIMLEGSDRNLGIWSSSRDGEAAFNAADIAAFNMERNGNVVSSYSSLSIHDPDGSGLSTVITVLLPWDDIAMVVCDEYSAENTFGAFVDGFLVEFTLNESGNWEYLW